MRKQKQKSKRVRKTPVPKAGKTTLPKPSQRVAKNKPPRPASTGVTKAVARMRERGISLRKAAREAKVSPRTVIRNAPSALRKKKSGRYGAKASDRLLRTLIIPTLQGPEEITVRGLRAASRLARYWVAVHKYYETGDVSGLQRFQDESITAVGGKKYPLLTDLDVLNRLVSAGVLSFESLYARGDA
jgi:hypothetical protein